MIRIRLGLLASTALVLMGGQGAEAAAPVPYPSVPYTWTGFYAGGNLGYSWGRADTAAAISPFAYTPFFYNFPGGAASFPLKPDGGIGGGQVGYNWQFAPRWVAGFEADLQWSGQKHSGLFSFGGTNALCSPSTCNFINTTDITAKLSWFSTVRGRVGMLSPDSSVLFYGTAGVAFGEVSVSGTNTLTLISNGGGTAAFATPFSYSGTKFGYVVGGGVEGRIGMSRWTWKAEYLHIDLGSIGGGSFGSVPVVALNTGRFTDDIVRVGFNYQFGPAPQP